MTFECQRCGWCCRNVVINISHLDITRWFNQGRNDILREISFINNYPHKNTGGFYVAKTTFNPKQPCPFLKGNVCTIHGTKPKACGDYPLASQCPNYNGEKSEALRQEQLRDFKLAFDNRNQLLKILVMARVE